MRAPLPLRLAPSILSADFARLADEVGSIAKGGADWVHVDVMDGHFVPNITIGIPVVAALRKATTLPLDVHLMISEPARYAEAFVKAGADILTFHVEAEPDAVGLCEKIRSLGARAGVAIRPGTSLRGHEAAFEAADLALVMTVEPGFGGQAFMHDMVERIATIFDMRGGEAEIEVDGGLNGDTVVRCARAGANAIVAGNYVFMAADRKARLDALRDGWARGSSRFQQGLQHSQDELETV